MKIEFITVEELYKFKKELIIEISELLSKSNTTNHKKWLKGSDVKKLLGISEGKLQQIRIEGLLKPTKILGVYYYKYSEIEDMMEG